MSKRHKFVLLTWCGPTVPALKKAKMSLEKTQVKNLMSSYAVEIQTSELEDMALDNVSCVLFVFLDLALLELTLTLITS